MQDYEELNASLLESRAALTKAESSHKEQESLARQLQEKCDIFKGELRQALSARAELETRVAQSEKDLEAERVARSVLESAQIASNKPEGECWGLAGGWLNVI